MNRQNPAIEEMLKFQRATEALEQVAQLVDWDQETCMPKGSAEQRAEWRGTLEGVIHRRKTSAEFARLLENAGGAAGDQFSQACLRNLRREVDRASRIPAELPATIAQVSSRAMVAWQEARSKEEVGLFLPLLEELVRLKREEANALSADGNAYGALLDTYEQGVSTEWLDAIFDRLRNGLVELRGKIFAAGRNIPGLTGRFPHQEQMALATELASMFGYDWERGRLDKSVHPFTSGSGNDVRITTRVSEDDPFNCLYSTIHEVGHACYEQRVRQEYLLTPLGKGASFGVHESQSRLFENQLGRSRAFSSWLFDRMRAVFGEIGISNTTAFYRAVNRLRNGHVRTEADEVQYNLHIMLRYQLERDLINGAVDVVDVEEAWNQRFLADFGFAVDRPSHGMLQDIHWAAALFGYFPTYTIGNIYAGCMYEVMRSDLPGLDAQLAGGNAGSAVEWLAGKVQQFGSLREPRELIESVTGKPVSEAPLLGYLQAKFGEIYEL